ncbi:MAG: hypothetical protein HY721_28820 [Planctomycetes bacterium]|nr:hypothetical protein [Planctomycetota bacterium]
MASRASIVITAVLLASAALPRGSRGDEYFDPVRAGTVTDPRITELSGMVPVTLHAGHYWIHNDSGDSPRVFAMRLDGAIVAEVEVLGAAATDWEDIARGPGPLAGETYLYIADTGNNGLDRGQLAVYRVLEPGLPSLEPGQVLASEPAEKLPFRYPDGSFDAEALVVHPSSGKVYVLTKDAAAPGVYRLPSLDPAAGVQTMARLGTLDYGDLITGADLSADGRRLLVRTYSEVLELHLPEGEPFERIFFQAAEARPGAPIETKSESICLDHRDRDVITSNESIPAPIHRLYAKVPRAACSYSVPEDSPRRFVRGDVLLEDGAPPGDVDAADAAAVVEVASGSRAPPCPDAADANDDGTLSLEDAATLLGSLASGKPLPQPFPQAALDSTGDPLGCREQARRVYLAEGDPWRYWHGSMLPEDDWMEPGADVSAWPQGPGGVGFGSSALGTALAGSPSSSISLRARADFTAGDAEELEGIDDLVLELDYNDGFVAYLNGVEVARRGLGDAGYDVPSEHAARSHAGGVWEELRLCPKLLRPGLNVLALDVRNRSRLDRTLFFRAALRGSAALAGTPPPAPAPEPSGRLRLQVMRGLSAGEEGVVAVLAAAGEPLRGTSFSIAYDPSVLSVLAVAAPEALRGKVLEASAVEASAGRLHHAMTVLPEAIGDGAFAAGDSILLAEVRCRVVAGAPGSTRLSFLGPAAAPRLESLLVLPGPRAAEPALEDLAVEVTAGAAPAIALVLDNRGVRGKVFLVMGTRLNQQGLQVKVCRRPARFTLLADGATLRVTAPGCEREGFAPLEVCNAFGCDVVEEGFFYTEAGPFWVRGDSNGDGTVDISDAVAVLGDLFLGVLARPACAEALDANADGRVDLSDAVFVLSFLFQGGADIPPPFPEPVLCR